METVAGLFLEKLSFEKFPSDSLAGFGDRKRGQKMGTEAERKRKRLGKEKVRERGELGCGEERDK